MPVAMLPLTCLASMSASEPPRLEVDWFDGQRARPRPVQIWLSEGHLHLQGENLRREFRRQAVRWAERTRHGPRQSELPDGSLLSCVDGTRWDAWARASGLQQPLAARLAQHWGAVLGLLLVIALSLFGTWRWGLPLAAREVASWVPPAVEQQLGAQLLAWLESGVLQPSALPVAQQLAWQQRLQALLQAAGERDAAPWRLEFRAAPPSLGPNAFALPGGTIVVTDELVQLLHDSPDALLGVLAHELGHLRHRHGLRLLIQGTAAAAVGGLLLGDYSGLLAAAQALLAERSYARDFERQADSEARRLLLAAGRVPSAMLLFFDRMQQYRRQHPQARAPLALASHPDDAERRAFFAH